MSPCSSSYVPHRQSQQHVAISSSRRVSPIVCRQPHGVSAGHGKDSVFSPVNFRNGRITSTDEPKVQNQSNINATPVDISSSATQKSRFFFRSRSQSSFS